MLFSFFSCGWPLNFALCFLCWNHLTYFSSLFCEPDKFSTLWQLVETW
jgi:hypothetical protein